MKQAPHIEGTRVPSVIFKTRVHDPAVTPNPYRWQDVSSDEIFAGKKIVLFALPGAFTPTCSSFHLPGYEALYEKFREKGIDEVYCLSVNDAFVMHNWRDDQKVEKVKFIPDGAGSFTRELGMLVSKNNLGFGDRSWRYSMYVEDGVVKKAFIEPGFSDDCEDDPFKVSDAQTMLAYLDSVT